VLRLVKSFYGGRKCHIPCIISAIICSFYDLQNVGHSPFKERRPECISTKSSWTLGRCGATTTTPPNPIHNHGFNNVDFRKKILFSDFYRRRFFQIEFLSFLSLECLNDVELYIFNILSHDLRVTNYFCNSFLCSPYSYTRLYRYSRIDLNSCHLLLE